MLNSKSGGRCDDGCGGLLGAPFGFAGEVAFWVAPVSLCAAVLGVLLILVAVGSNTGTGAVDNAEWWI